MKPLSIEELKAMELGDWVWIVEKENAYPNNYFHGEYCHITPPYIDGLCDGWRGRGGCYKYSDFGTKWLAYKNKEQAECKGVLKNLICDIGDKVYIVKKICNCFSIDDGIIECITIMGNTIYYNWNSYDYRGEQIELWDEGEFTADDLGKSIFLDYKQAERKLKELRGE